MPAIYTHYAVAHALFNTLSPKKQAVIAPYLPLYYFGAQGADFCFFYHVFGNKAQNLGSQLHRKNVYEVFCLLKDFSVRNPRLFAYALGYLTHYATDATFHPYVYATTGKSYSQHSRLENAMDAHFKPLIQPLITQKILRKPTKEETEQLYILYATIAKIIDFPALLPSNFFRAVALFNAYPPISSTLFQSKNSAYIDWACNKEKRSWRNPADQLSQPQTDGADELFEKALSFAQTAAAVFFRAVLNDLPLPMALFNKNFLTGLSPLKK